MIWSPNKELGGQFAGYVTVINGEYDCDRGLNCEYCSFHCTSYFHTMLYRRFEDNLGKQLKLRGLSSNLSQQEKMKLFEKEVNGAVNNTKYNNSENARNQVMGMLCVTNTLKIQDTQQASMSYGCNKLKGMKVLDGDSQALANDDQEILESEEIP